MVIVLNYVRLQLTNYELVFVSKLVNPHDINVSLTSIAVLNHIINNIKSSKHPLYFQFIEKKN